VKSTLGRSALILFFAFVSGVPGPAAGPAAGSTLPAAGDAGAGATKVPETALMQPAELAKLVASDTAPKPLVIQVGFRVLYVQAHIPGSEYIGPASGEAGLAKLRERVAALPKTQLIVLYCGCCPWVRCPNMLPAYGELHRAGFTNVKVLYVEKNFGADWVDHGYPVAKGE
jgi:rhodanese-related sulfurtransferase